MNTAKKVVDKFGGQSSLARALGKGQSTVSYWTRAGRIPSKWHSVLLRLASDQGIELSPRDLVDGADSQESGVIGPPQLPVAKWPGTLSIADAELPCYVLSDGRRVISRTGATNVLTCSKGGGNLDSYIGVKALKPYLPKSLPDQLIAFTIPGVVNKTVQGMAAETFLEICRAYSTARDDGASMTDRQLSIAIQANMFLMSCAKVGLIALIDEATGYQYERAHDALQFKLKVYLEEEMRKWESTFPEELWEEFARLTRWKGAIHHRPKYWGKLVMELVYEYLDTDVANWLRENAPSPRKGQNYHQWLTSQFGLKKLVEHLWMLIGMARACHTMPELRERMAQQFGREGYQLHIFLPPPALKSD